MDVSHERNDPNDEERRQARLPRPLAEFRCKIFPQPGRAILYKAALVLSKTMEIGSRGALWYPWVWERPMGCMKPLLKSILLLLLIGWSDGSLASAGFKACCRPKSNPILSFQTECVVSDNSGRKTAWFMFTFLVNYESRSGQRQVNSATPHACLCIICCPEKG